MSKHNFDVRIKKILANDPETVAIYCHEVDEGVKELVQFVKMRQGLLQGNIGERQFAIALPDIYYMEAVDNKIFICCKDQVYESRQKLYKLEELLEARQFIRVSKSVLLNLMKVQELKPAMNGRFLAKLKNGEEIMISRKYVPELKKTIKGGRDYER